MPSYISTKSATWPDLTVGSNCFILENQTIQPTVVIGNNVVLGQATISDTVQGYLIIRIYLHM